MCLTVLQLLIVVTLSCPSCAEDKTEATVSCPEHQKGFLGSCYEFVDHQHPFFRAQAWCEESGGHLALIPDEDTQHFLQTYLDPEKNTWIGVAAVEGALSWLDGSHITYSNWASRPQPEAACVHILKDSGFRWEATADCNKKLHFICQFEPGRSIVCADHNTTLQCASGQVLIIDSGFYGHKNSHYCQSSFSLPATSLPHQCGWIDVGEKITAHCRGRQVCLISEVMNSFGEMCPQLGSYLSVDYHCKDGLTLTMNSVAAVFMDVTIGIKWLWHFSWRKLICRLSTGDGRIIHLDTQQGFESTLIHKYTSPSVFVVAVECSSNDTHITTQRTISILEPVTELSVMGCYAGALFFHVTNCKALYGEAIHIQIEAKAGSNVTYRIQSDEMVLSSVSVVRGNVSHNLTVTPGMMKHLGPGCHHLSLYASNTVTFPEVSTDLQVCVLEKVAGLQVSLLPEGEDCLDSPDVTVGVSLERGAPVQIFFSLTGENGNSLYETREMNGRKGIFHIGHTVQGPVQITLRVQNDFSSLELDVNMLASCVKDSVIQLNNHNEHWFGFNQRLRKQHVRVARSPLSIAAVPSPLVSNRLKYITLSVKEISELTDPEKRYQWVCKHPCKCQGEFETKIYTIREGCLPDPFEFNKYRFNVIDKDDNEVEKTQSICIGLFPEPDSQALLSLSCTENCNPARSTEDTKIQMECKRNDVCSQVVWHIEDPRNYRYWPLQVANCYKNSGKTPLIERRDGGTQYTVNKMYLVIAKLKRQDVTVVVTYGRDEPLFTKYIIKTSQNPSPTPKHPGAHVTTAKVGENKPQTPAAGDPITAAPGRFTTSNAASPFLPSTTKNADGLSCSINPSNGTILIHFNITCKTEIPCSKCHYCFKAEGKHLRCSKKNAVKAVFLPLGDSSSDYKLIITAKAKYKSFVVGTTITTQVKDSTEDSGSSVEHLKVSVEDTVAQLRKQGLLSAETIGQMLTSVSNKLNSQSDESKKADRQKLREQILNIMVDTVAEAPISSPEEVQLTARALTAVVQKGSELSSTAQAEASLFFANLSSCLANMKVNESEEILTAASTIVKGMSHILSYSSNKNISDSLLVALENTQSALLNLKDTNEGPTIIQESNIGVFVNRVTLESLHTESINIQNGSSPTFHLPHLPSSIFPSEESVDIRMLSLQKNPFSWNERGNISGLIGALSLTTKQGSGINVENLSEDIEILLPRPVGEQVNTSVLDLGNFSTTIIDVPSEDSTLVLKMVPSEDPLPFKLYLGYAGYPTDTNYIAMTEMPHQGTTQEERYSWILNPKSLKGNTGLHYLVVRPIVGPGIKSINASLSITPITAACKYWNESILDWSDTGCRVGVQTTHLVTQCLCNHLTFFGSSFFVTPNLVDPSRSAELFGTFAENPVVVCFVGALFVVYLLVLVWAQRKDIQDTAKVIVTVLEDNDPLDEYCYLLSVSTGHRRGASTSSKVTITLLGADENSEPHHLTDPKKRVFERGEVDTFLVTTPFSLGDLQGIRLWHNNSGSHPAWYVGNVMVQDTQTNQKWHFLCNSWLAIDMGDCTLDKVFPVSTEMDLKRFSNLFFMKTAKDLSDGHLWYSVISRPPRSTFTCVQRVSCCFSLLLCTMLTSIMFYGIPTDPSEQTMDLGHFEFTWQQFMIGVQSSLIMFPVNILIVGIFRNTRPRETSCCKCNTEKTHACEQEQTSQTPSSQTSTTNSNTNVTLDNIIKDITRVAHVLSKTVKSNIPCTEFWPGQHFDINAVLCVVEDFMRLNIKNMTNTDVIQKKSNKTQYLYMQLCHIDKELSLLGPSGFPSPHSYNQALQQVQGMKSFLEDQLLTSSSTNHDELTQRKCGPADAADGDSGQKKSVCCHGRLPWWFIFVGWLLVIGTSVVSGYFTMLYGLKFGKERSINWLVSMIVSFFQSTLVIQPLKVLCLAAFFALVIKKVDEEDFQYVAFVKTKSSPGDLKDQQTLRLDRNLYEPPHPADIERIKRTKIMEQKAFALLKEILAYFFFFWMLLLVVYNQRDPNAFYLNRHIRDSFSSAVTDSMSLEEVFTWTSTTLLSNLFGVYPGFITDGNSKLVGKARLRQLRVKKNSCQTASSMLQFVPNCHAPYSWEVEDTGSYYTGWNGSVRGDNATSPSSSWMYQTQDQLRAHSVWGKMVLYRGGGFVADLGPDLQNASSTLDYLFRNKWLDMYTRAVIVEFTVYNANVNLFCIVTLLFETAAIGAFQFHTELHSVRLYQSTGGLHIFVMATEIIYLLFILYYMFLQGKLMKQQRWAYFRSKWNLLELAIISLSWGAAAAFVTRTLLGNRDVTYYHHHKDQFANFYETATTDLVLQSLIAFLVLLATVKLWHLLRLNPKMNLITASLQRAWSDISGFLMIIVILFIAYSCVSNLTYGWRLSSYRTFTDALLTIISLQMGIFNYDEVLDCNLLLSGLLFGSCIVIMTFVLLNLLISVILMAFSHEQIYHKPSEEEEIVALMLKKICSLFGIRYKDTKDSQQLDMNGSSGLTLNNSRIIPGE